MTVDEFHDKTLPIKKELSEAMRLKTPTIYPLEGGAQRLLNLVNQLRKESEEANPSLYSIKRELDIYLADLDGELLGDYRKGNKRYKGKWDAQRTKLVGIMGRLREYLQKEESTEEE